MNGIRVLWMNESCVYGLNPSSTSLKAINGGLEENENDVGIRKSECQIFGNLSVSVSARISVSASRRVALVGQV
ncbi:unnamed protein product [Dovyalis caffra]|uniref:Uncharacterized protein n=1 Tax=Dovyalis caffra TaxID=77055 RepID=A0AAV1SF16_9ROSI|nr:unnamed protein product [Dovyalis caffra]